MTLNFKLSPAPQTFKDVPVNKFYKDYQGDLMLKIDSFRAIRIAKEDGLIDTRSFEPTLDTGVVEIYNIDKIEF